MYAVVHDTYGPPEDVLKLRELAAPQIDADEVLVRVDAAAIAGDDWHLLRGEPYAIRPVIGVRRPRQRVLSRDIAGRIAAVGARVARLKVGDEVFGCRGALAEYAAVKEDMLAVKPSCLTAEQAAAVPVSALTALQALRDKGRLRSGQHVLVIGASGGVGTFAVQIAKALGAEVTGVCGSGSVDLVRHLGADRVVDYTQEDYTTAGVRFDVVVDLVGDRSFADLRRTLQPDGTLVVVGGSGGRWAKGADRWLKALALTPFMSQRLRPLVHQDRGEDLVTIKEMIEAGQVEPVVSATYPLRDAPRAIAHFRGGHGRGKVVIRLGEEGRRAA